MHEPVSDMLANKCLLLQAMNNAPNLSHPAPLQWPNQAASTLAACRCRGPSTATACARFPSIAKPYDLVRSRSSAKPYLEGTERMAETYADMMKKNPAGVVA